MTRLYQQATHLWLVTAELSVAVRKALKTNGDLYIAAAHDVLNLELGELGVEAELLDDACVLARGEARVVLGLCAGDDHLARCENEGSRLGVADTHDDRGETLKVR